MHTLILALVLILVPGAFFSRCQAQDQTAAAAPVAAAKNVTSDEQQMRASIKQLSTENEQLRAKLAGLERRLKSNSVRDRLTQEEQRGATLEEQLFFISKDEAPLQEQLEEVNEQLRPENIQQLQIYGSLRPEEVREATRRKLTNQQTRLQAQLQLLQQRRARILSSISVTDMLILNLKAQLQAVVHN